MKKDFTLEKGISVQLEQLQVWMPKLSTECFHALLKKCVEENARLTDKNTGFDVFRGNDMTSFIENWKP